MVVPSVKEFVSGRIKSIDELKVLRDKGILNLSHEEGVRFLLLKEDRDKNKLFDNEYNGGVPDGGNIEVEVDRINKITYDKNTPNLEGCDDSIENHIHNFRSAVVSLTSPEGYLMGVGDTIKSIDLNNGKRVYVMAMFMSSPLSEIKTLLDFLDGMYTILPGKKQVWLMGEDNYTIAKNIPRNKWYRFNIPEDRVKFNMGKSIMEQGTTPELERVIGDTSNGSIGAGPRENYEHPHYQMFKSNAGFAPVKNICTTLPVQFREIIIGSQFGNMSTEAFRNMCGSDRVGWYNTNMGIIDPTGDASIIMGICELVDKYHSSITSTTPKQIRITN